MDVEQEENEGEREEWKRKIRSVLYLEGWTGCDVSHAGGEGGVARCWGIDV